MGTLRNPKKAMGKAIKFTDKKGTRPILGCVRLEDGKAIATDSYRMIAVAGVWDGEPLTIPADLAAKMAKIPASHRECEVEAVGNEVVCRYGGNVIRADATEGKYPNVGTFLKPIDAKAVAEVPVKQAAVLCRAHDRVRVDISDGCCVISGGDDPEPAVRFDKCSQGAGIAEFNGKCLESALKACGDKASICLEASMKPAQVRNGSIACIVMPVKLGQQKGKPKVAERKDEGMKKKETGMGGFVVYGTTKDGKAGWVSSSDHMTNKGAEEWLRRTARRTDGTELASVKSEFFSDGAERDKLAEDAKAKLKRLCDKVVTWRGGASRNTGLASTWERPATEVVVTRARITPTPDGVKAEVVERRTEKIEKPKPEDAAAVVSLEYMKAWCSEREDVIATQKREGCCIWVEGVTKPYQAELKELGFRWGKSRKAWYFDPKRVA